MLSKKIKIKNLARILVTEQVIYISNLNYIDSHIPKGKRKWKIFLLDQTSPNPFLFPNHNKNAGPTNLL